MRLYLSGIASISCLAVCFWGGIPSALAAATYFVDGNNSQANDSNPGTQTQPWKTIQKSSTTMIAGDTTIVVAGTYNEQVLSTRNGQPGNRISFKTSGNVTVNGFTLSHSYVTVDGFIIPKNYSITSTGSFCEILNNHLYDSYIRIPGSSSTSNCHIKGNRIEGTTGWGSDWTAVELGGSNHIVENNEIGPIKDTDAFRPFGHDSVIRNNYIHDITLSPGSSAHMDIFQVFGDNGNEISYNMIFENNRIMNCTGQMFMTSVALDGTGGDRLHDFDVRNNVWVNIAMQGNVGIPNFRFYNNTLYNADYVNGFALYLYGEVWGNPNGARILNNIFIDGGGVNNTSVRGAYYIVKGNNLLMDYNYVARGPSKGYAALTGFTEPHGINGGDPKFIDIGKFDFHLQQSSPAIDKGLTLAGFNYDADKASRPQGMAWDLGAFESLSLNSNLNAPTNLRVIP